MLVALDGERLVKIHINGGKMKRYGKLFDKICDMENIKEAHKNARKGKLFYKEVKAVDSNPDFYLGEIRKMLLNGTYKVSPYFVEERVMYQTIGIWYNHLKTKVDDYKWQLSKLSVRIATRQMS